MSSRYLQSIQEVRQFLSYKRLDEFIYILLDNGYDDLDSIAQCSSEEMNELEDLFQTPDTKRSLQILVESLRVVGIDAYRKGKNEFRRLVALDDPQQIVAEGKQQQKLSGGGMDQQQQQQQQQQQNSQQSQLAAQQLLTNNALALAQQQQAELLAQQQQYEIAQQQLLQQQQILLQQQQQMSNIQKAGSASVRAVPTSPNWSDKWVVLDNIELRWYSSRRAVTGQPEQIFSLGQLLIAVEKPDINTVKLTLASGIVIEIGFDEDKPQDTSDWFDAFVSVIGEGPQSEELKKIQELQQQMAQQQQQVMQMRIQAEEQAQIAAAQAAQQQQQGGNNNNYNHGGAYDSNGSNNEQMSRQSFGSFPDDGEEAQFDVDSLEGAVNLHAYFRAKLALTRTILDPIPEEELERRIIGNRIDSVNMRVKKYLTQLNTGALFKKFKRNNSAKRLIWVSPQYDYVCWGSEDKLHIKGFISTIDIQEINQGYGKHKCRLSIVSPNRTLELEAKDATTAKEWKSLFEFLMGSNCAELEQKNKLYNKIGMSDILAEAAQEYTKMLSDGDVFKKWPSKKTIQKGGLQQRRIWTSPNVDRLQWGHPVTKEVKGELLMQDVCYIQEDATDKLKFTIFAQKRSLDLEAKSVWVREKWVRALRFFTDFKKRV